MFNQISGIVKPSPFFRPYIHVQLLDDASSAENIARLLSDVATAGNNTDLARLDVATLDNIRLGCQVFADEFKRLARARKNKPARLVALFARACYFNAATGLDDANDAYKKALAACDMINDLNDDSVKTVCAQCIDYYTNKIARIIDTVPTTTEPESEPTTEPEPTTDATTDANELYKLREVAGAFSRLVGTLSAALINNNRAAQLRDALDFSLKTISQFLQAYPDARGAIEAAREKLQGKNITIDAARRALRDIIGTIQARLTLLNNDIRDASRSDVINEAEDVRIIYDTCSSYVRSWTVLDAKPADRLAHLERASIARNSSILTAAAVNAGFIDATFRGAIYSTPSGGRSIIERVQNAARLVLHSLYYAQDNDIENKLDEARKNAVNSADIFGRDKSADNLRLAVISYVNLLAIAARAGLSVEKYAAEYLPSSLFAYYATEFLDKGLENVNIERLLRLDPIASARLDYYHITNKQTAKATTAPAPNVEPKQEPSPTPTVEPKQEPATVEEMTVETVEENNVEEIDDDDETSGEETRDEKALESVAAPTVKALAAGRIVWRHLTTTTSEAPRSWDSLRPYSINNQMIVASSGEAGGVLYITQEEADVKEDGRSTIDWREYASDGAEIWQPKGWRIIPIKNDDGSPALDDDGRPLVTRRPKKYGKIAVFNAARYPWLDDKRAAKLATIERRAKEEQQERDEKRAALLGDEPVLWVTNLAALVRRYFDQTKLTPERRELGEEIARYVIGARLGISGMSHAHKDEAADAARILKIATQGDKKHGTVGHALQKILRHVNKCASAILYEKPAPVPTAAPNVKPETPAEAPSSSRVPV